MEKKRRRRSPEGERKGNWIFDAVGKVLGEIAGLLWLYVRTTVLILFLGVKIRTKTRAGK